MPIFHVWEVGVLIDLFLSGLVLGYDQIRDARRILLEKWRFVLLRVYSKKWKQFKERRDRREARRVRLNRFLPWIAGGALVLCISGYWLFLTDLCLGSLLLLGVFIGAVVTAVSWGLLARKLEPPDDPVGQIKKEEFISPLKQVLFPDLVPLWRQRFQVRVPFFEEVQKTTEQNEDWGLIGEYDLIRELEMVVSDRDTFILHRLQQNHGDDLDVAVIGPKGFWYFEVKHHNAHFEWRNGRWDIWREDRRTGQHVPVKLVQDPDAQWARMRSDALKTLDLHGRDLLRKAPHVAEIKGGLVFSNVNAETNISASAPFAWDTIPGWIQRYQKAPRLKEMTPEVTLWLTEVLLKRHQSLHPEHKVYSMTAHAAKVTREMETKIQSWIGAG